MKEFLRLRDFHYSTGALLANRFTGKSAGANAPTIAVSMRACDGERHPFATRYCDSFF
jgi:hypothetical protein